jgi:hypothetical protein
VRCIAKKVNFFSFYLPPGDNKTLWRSFICDWSFLYTLLLQLGHSEGARKVVSMFRGLVRI